MQGQKHNAKKQTKNAKKMQGQKHNATKNKWKLQTKCKNAKKQVQKHTAKQCKTKMQKMQAQTKKVDVKIAKKIRMDAM